MDRLPVCECEAVHREIRRFAGEQSLSDYTTIHFVAATHDGCRALQDCGIKGLIALCGNGRCSYYLDSEASAFLDQNGLVQDTENGLIFIRNDMVINAVPEPDIVPQLDALRDSGKAVNFLEIMIHEQYFHPDYPYHLPDFAIMPEALFSSRYRIKSACVFSSVAGTILVTSSARSVFLTASDLTA